MGTPRDEEDDDSHDADLMRRLAHGDLCALRELHDRHYQRALTQAGRWLGDFVTGQGVVEAAFAGVWESRHRFVPGSFSKWFYGGVLEHKIKDALRARAVAGRQEEAARGRAGPGYTDADTTSIEDAEQTEVDRAAVARILATLSPFDRWLIQQARLDRKAADIAEELSSDPDLARRLGVRRSPKRWTAGYVRVRKHRALKRLRERATAPPTARPRPTGVHSYKARGGNKTGDGVHLCASCDQAPDSPLHASRPVPPSPDDGDPGPPQPPLRATRPTLPRTVPFSRQPDVACPACGSVKCVCP